MHKKIIWDRRNAFWAKQNHLIIDWIVVCSSKWARNTACSMTKVSSLNTFQSTVGLRLIIRHCSLQMNQPFGTRNVKETTTFVSLRWHHLVLCVQNVETLDLLSHAGRQNPQNNLETGIRKHLLEGLGIHHDYKPPQRKQLQHKARLSGLARHLGCSFITKVARFHLG